VHHFRRSLDRGAAAVALGEPPRAVDRTAVDETQVVEDCGDGRLVHLLVLGREGVDRRRHDQTAAVIQEVRQVGKARENEGVRPLEVGLEKDPPSIALRRHLVVADVAAPDHRDAAPRQMRNQTGSLRIVQDHQIRRLDDPV
jgi:hypothetical protein